MNRERVVNWYVTLTPRDQRVLHIGAVVVVAILLAGLFLPLQRSLALARAQLQTRQQDLEWMKRVAPTLIAAGTAPVAVASRESLAVLVDQSARESGLAAPNTQAMGSGALTAQFEHADFNVLTGLISRLASQHGVRVENASFTSSNTPGVVNASLQLHQR